MLLVIYASMMSLALGLFTSMTFLALTHIFILVPCIYFLNKTNYKVWNKSSWFLLGLIIAIILSIILNQDIIEQGYKSVSKVKYYLLALLAITPFSYWFEEISKNPTRQKKLIQYLFIAFFVTTSLASISGMMGVFLGINILKWKFVYADRNGGLAGMLMNYAHNLCLFQIIVLGFIIYKESIKEYINTNFLYVVFFINLLALYTTYTRGAILAFLVGIPFFFLRKHRKLFLISSVALVVIAAAMYKLGGTSFIRPQSDIERTSQWKAAITGFKERPVFGLGYLNFEKLSIPLKIKYNIEAINFGGHAHSNYFEMLASTGIVGFMFFVLWQLSWFVEMYKRDDILGKLGVAFIAVFVVGGLTQATFTLGANLFFIMPVYAITQINPRVLKK